MASAPRRAPANGDASADTLPVQLPVRGRLVTVVGSSGRAITTTGSLMNAGAVVTVVSPAPTAYLSDLADRGLIAIHERDVVNEDIDSAALVFACTGDQEADGRIAARALDRGVFCIVDEPRRSPTTNGHTRVGRVTLVGGGLATRVCSPSRAVTRSRGPTSSSPTDSPRCRFSASSHRGPW